MEETKATKNSGYSSRFALTCILIGGSVGTGNLWRFPRLVGQMGGAFILVMVACVFLQATSVLHIFPETALEVHRQHQRSQSAAPQRLFFQKPRNPDFHTRLCFRQ